MESIPFDRALKPENKYTKYETQWEQKYKWIYWLARIDKELSSPFHRWRDKNTDSPIKENVKQCRTKNNDPR